MNGNRKGFYLFLVGIAMMMAFFVAASPAPVQADNPNPALPADFTLHGKTGDQWSAEWWQWAYKIPSANHPINQVGNVDCSAYQTGRVWFLGGTFGGVVGHDRTCTIPKNTYLWFPVLNWVMWRPGDCVTDQECYDLARSYGDATNNVVVTVDGDPVPNVVDYRFNSAPFKFKIKDGGIHQGDPNNTAYPHLIPGLMYDGFDDGYYMMLKPLSPGEHTIHFSADSTFGFSVSMTYHLTVTE